MFVPPIIERDLRRALRQQATVKYRWHIAATAAAVAAVFMLGGMMGFCGWGVSLHEWLFYGGLYFAIVPALQVSSSLFADERRNQTLELLFLAGLNPFDLFAGKLTAGILAASVNLLAITPVLAVPFLSGGITSHLYLAALVCFPALLILAVAIGTLASILCADEGAALACAITAAAILTLAIPLPNQAGILLAGKPVFSAAWTALSPGYAPYLVLHRFGAAESGLFWQSIVSSLLWAVLFLAAAVLLVKSQWKREIERAAALTPLDRHFAFFGKPSQKAARRARMLDRNPFEWMAGHNRRTVRLAWGCLAGIVILWLGAWYLWPAAWLSPINFYATAFFLFMGTDLLAAYAASCRIGSDRRSGALELILTTPLWPADIVDGQVNALKSEFRPIRFAITGLCAVMIVAGLWRGNFNIPATISYLIAWSILLCWCYYGQDGQVTSSIWVALNTGLPAGAMFRGRGFGNNWWWVYWIINMRSIARGGGAFTRFPTGSGLELTLVIFGCLFVFVFLVFTNSNTEGIRSRLILQMREIAQLPPPEPNDPRLKKWRDLTQRLPDR